MEKIRIRDGKNLDLESGIRNTEGKIKKRSQSENNAFAKITQLLLVVVAN
jgi:hypothetical protein